MTGTTSRDAKRGAVAFRVLTAFVLLLLFTSSVGRAQVPGPLETDASCNPAAYDDMQQFQAEVCASHAGCNIYRLY